MFTFTLAKHAKMQLSKFLLQCCWMFMRLSRISQWKSPEKKGNVKQRILKHIESWFIHARHKKWSDWSTIWLIIEWSGCQQKDLSNSDFYFLCFVMWLNRLMCWFSWDLYANSIRQIVQTYSLATLCLVAMWPSKSPLRRSPLPQSSHLNRNWFRCADFWCWFRLSKYMNRLLHCGHWTLSLSSLRTTSGSWIKSGTVFCNT